MKGQLTTAPSRTPRFNQDSGPIACAAGITTELLAALTAKTKWIQINVDGVAPAGNLVIQTGPAGLEVPLFTWYVGAGYIGDVANMPYEIPAGTRISCNPTMAVGVVEFHAYW